MADNLTDAQKVMADVARQHQQSDEYGYGIEECRCGERFPGDYVDHLAREIDEALGGLTRAYGAVTAEYQEQREWSCGHEQEFPTRDHVSLDQGDTINGHWISGWTPEEDS